MSPSLVAAESTTLSGVTQQYDVTSVGVNPAKDRAYRMRMYFLTMSLRVVCVVSLFWVRGFWIILVGVGAVVLPYIAVLIANAVSHEGGRSPDAPSPLELTGAEPASYPLSDAAAEASPAPGIIVIDAPAERRSSSGAGATGDPGAAAGPAGATDAGDAGEGNPEGAL